MCKPCTLLGSVAVLALLSLSRPTMAQFQVFDLNPPGFTFSLALGISDGQEAGWGSGPATGGSAHGLLWTGADPHALDLAPPPGFVNSRATAIYKGQVVGYAELESHDFITPTHALLWSGTPLHVTDLNPPGSNFTRANAIYGDQQVGEGPLSQERPRAVLWTGTAASYTSLNPSGSASSYATGVYAGKQVGTNGIHATLWSGTADSAIDLSPPDFGSTFGTGISGNHEVGYGYSPTATNGNYHALLWSGTAASLVDLNPSGFTTTQARAISGDIEVGSGSGPATGGHTHALLWLGTTPYAIDLNRFLPAGIEDAVASGVDANGDVVGTAGGHAYLWQRIGPLEVPEPGSLGLLLGAGLSSLAVTIRRLRHR